MTTVFEPKKPNTKTYEQRSKFYPIWERGVRLGLIPGLEKESREWFRKEAAKVKIGANVRTEVLMPETQMKKTILLPGKMYCFQYDALHKNELPYWDQYPLIFPFKVEGDRFWGYNLHYLNRQMRALMMDALYEKVNSHKFDANLRLQRIAWEYLKGIRKYRHVKPTIHQYLIKQVRSPLYEIPSMYWDIALMLPTERFQKMAKTRVWRDSAKIIRESKK